MPLFDGLTFQCCEIKDSEREIITRLIEENGGNVGMVDAPLVFMPRKRFNPELHYTNLVYDVDFIKNCIEEGRIVDLEHFRLGSTTPYDVCIRSTFLTGQCEHKSLRKKMLSYISSLVSHMQSPSSYNKICKSPTESSRQKKILRRLWPTHLKRETSGSTASFETACSALEKIEESPVPRASPSSARLSNELKPNTSRATNGHGKIVSPLMCGTTSDRHAATRSSSEVINPYFRAETTSLRKYGSLSKPENENGEKSFSRSQTTFPRKVCSLSHTDDENGEHSWSRSQTTSSKKDGSKKRLSNPENENGKKSFARSQTTSPKKLFSFSDTDDENGEPPFPATPACSRSHATASKKDGSKKRLSNPENENGEKSYSRFPTTSPKKVCSWIETTPKSSTTIPVRIPASRRGTKNLIISSDDDDSDLTDLDIIEIPPTISSPEESRAGATSSHAQSRSSPPEKARRTVSSISPIGFDDSDAPGPSGIQSRIPMKISETEDDDEEDEDSDTSVQKSRENRSHRRRGKHTTPEKLDYHTKWRRRLSRNISRSSRKVGKVNFRPSERREMVRYLCDHKNLYDIQPRGLKIWASMLQDGFLLHRTPKSLQNHFVTQILPNIEDYFDMMTNAQKKIFKSMKTSKRKL